MQRHNPVSIRPRFSLLVILIILNTAAAWSQNRNLSGGIVFDGEPFLAVNPQNPQHMVVAWMGYVFLNRISIKTRVSFNGGQSWSNTVTIPHAADGYTSADPSLDFDGAGNVFLSYIDHDDEEAGAVYLRKSTDGGFSWETEVPVIYFDSDPGKLPIDRPWISIDRSGGANHGNIYITTMNAKGADGPPYHPYLTVSENNGLSFGDWRTIDTTGWFSGPFIPQPMPTPVVVADGKLHCIYPSYVLSQGILPRYIIAGSNNAGNSFEYNTVFASSTSVAVTDTSAKKGYLLRSNPADAEELAFLYLSTEYGDPDVICRISGDGGSTWSDGIRVNDDLPGNGRMQDLVWAAYDQDGDLAVTWRDRRNAQDTGYAASYEIWGAVKLKNTDNFTSNFRISDLQVPFDDILLTNGNDFMCCGLRDDTISAVWGDTRNGTLNIWMQRTTINGTLVSSQNLSGEPLPELTVIQSGDKKMTLRSSGIKSYSVFSASGQLLLRQELTNPVDEITLNPPDFPTGLYIIKAVTAYGPVKSGVIIR